MKTHRLIAIVAASPALGPGASAALAETEVDMSFDGMVAMSRMDKNKDGMVSKKECMDMMSAVWDQKAKRMNIKTARMSTEDFRRILMYLKADS